MSDSMKLFYGTAVGRTVLKTALKAGLPKVMATYLNSPLSKYRIPGFIKKNGISMEAFPNAEYGSFGEFFSRERELVDFDGTKEHYISPCDGYFSMFPIENDSSFAIKNSQYRVCDLVDDEEIAAKFKDGLCLIFRLTAKDYHHYCFVDDGYVHEHHFREGELHSVQPIACEHYPVFRLNRRCWSLMETENFGPIAQIEIGAMAVGGMVNPKENDSFQKGEDMGHFTLCGSTIVHLVTRDSIAVLPEIRNKLKIKEEVRVLQGMHIANKQ